MLVVLQAVPSLVLRPSAVNRAPVPLMVTEQQTFFSKVAQGALASAVALQLAQPVPVGALTFEAAAPGSIAVPAPVAAPVDAAPAPAPAPSAVAAPVPAPPVATEAAAARAEAAREARAEVEAAEAEAAVAQAEAVAAAAAQKAFASKLAADQGYDAAYAAALKKAEAAVTKAAPAAPASTDSEDFGFLSGVGGKGVILPLIAGFAVLSVTESVFNRMVDDNARKTGGKLSANEIYQASKSTGIGSDWLKAALSTPNREQAAPAPAYAPPPAPAYAPAYAPAAPRGAAAGQQRSAPDILFGGLGNLGKDPFGWCFGPPSSLYSNAGSGPTSASTYNNPSTASTAGFQPPTAGSRASQPYAAPAGTEAMEATRDGDEDAAKAAWLSNQNSGMQPPAQQPWQAQAAPEPWNLSPNGAPAAQAPQQQAEAPQQAEDAAPKGYLQDPGSWSMKN